MSTGTASGEASQPQVSSEETKKAPSMLRISSDEGDDELTILNKLMAEQQSSGSSASSMTSLAKGVLTLLAL